MIWRLVLVGPLLLSGVALQGEVEMRAALNRQTAEVGGTVLLTVTLRAPGLQSPEVEDPAFEGLEVLSRSDRSSFRFSPTLGALREFSREYTLRAERPGELLIPPIRASVGGVFYETEALNLVVEREGAAAEIPGGLLPRAEEEVAVRLWVEPETAFVGQQVTLTVAAFFDPLVRGRLQRQPEYRPPEVEGFWTADLPGSPRPERQLVGGREYFVQVYRRALFPLSPGAVTIPPAAVIYEVRRGLIYAPETFQVESPPVSVVVEPLPERGAPAGFSGAVGRYQTEIWFDRADLRAGQAVNLVLEVSGSGNLSALARPALPEVPGLRVYEGGEDAEVQLRGVEFAGQKRFSWVLVPERAGQYVLPELRLSYFDPERASYEVARSEPISLLVEPAATAALTPSRGAAIRFVKAEPGRQPLNLPARREFWLVQAVPLLVVVGVLAAARLRRVTLALRGAPSGRRSRALRELRGSAEQGDATFYTQLRMALLDWLEGRLQRPKLAGQGVVEVQHALEDAGVPPAVALDVTGLLERCGRLRYAPEAPGADVALQVLREARKLLALIDKEAVSERALRSARRAKHLALSALLLAAGSASAAAQRPVSEDEAALLFREGVAAYGRGEYAEAARGFERALTQRPRDPHLLYNLGNANYELEQRGRAVAAWVRALRIAPRDADARYNLRLAIGDDPVVSGALQPLPLSRDELALVFAILWFAGCGAWIARWRWRRGYLSFAGGAALALAAICAVLLLYPRPGYAIISQPGAALRAGPVRQSEVLASPAPGTGYRVQEQRGGWVRVGRAGESEGWVERSQVELID